MPSSLVRINYLRQDTGFENNTLVFVQSFEGAKCCISLSLATTMSVVNSHPVYSTSGVKMYNFQQELDINRTTAMLRQINDNTQQRSHTATELSTNQGQRRANGLFSLMLFKQQNCQAHILAAEKIEA